MSAFISVHKLDVICLSGTSTDDDNLEIPGYNIISKDHPSNTKHGGVCVYYKNILPFKLINIKYLFTSQTNLANEFGVHSFLHPNCHHQVVFAKFDLLNLYPPPYDRTVWFYEKANPELIQRAIDEFDWIRAPSNVSIDRKVCYFTKTLLNIIHGFIPHERIVCDDRDPPWMNNEIKKLINKKSVAYKSYCCFNRDVFLFKKFKFL